MGEGVQQPLSFGIEEEYLLVDLRSARVLATLR